jgi:hypothetical protein
MPDSNPSDRDREALAAKHERNREQRLEGVKRWVEYIREQPPEVWGAEQNRLIDSQLESARETGLSADHEQRVRAFATAATAEFDRESDPDC